MSGRNYAKEALEALDQHGDMHGTGTALALLAIHEQLKRVADAMNGRGQVMTREPKPAAAAVCGHESVGHNDGPCCVVCDLSAQLDATRSELAACAALVEAQRERDQWKRALEELTPSGSEYVNDPAACVAFVRSVRESQHSALSRFKKRADAAESELARLRPVVQAAEAHDRAMRVERDRVWCKALLTVTDLRVVQQVVTAFNSTRPDPPLEADRFAAHQRIVDGGGA